MALDGFVIASVVYQLNTLLQGNKIEKIYQPESDELILLIRAQGKNHRLLLSANSQYPRVHLTEEVRENPTLPPSFCMLLRKHLQGGRILSVEQLDFERIIQIKVESYDELNFLKHKTLIVEIMGKHSNIILVDGETQKILDAIKRVSFDMSRFRQVLPALPYEMPPSQDKLNPMELRECSEFQEVIAAESQGSLFKRIYGVYTGVSPLLAREICFRAGVPEDMPVLGVSSNQYEQLYMAFRQIVEKTLTQEFSPALYVDPATGNYKAFHVFSMTHLSLYQQEAVETTSQMLETFYYQNDFTQRMKQRNQTLRKNIALKLERQVNKIQNLKQDMKNAEKADEFRILADLITGNLHLLHGKEASVRVINYFDPEMPEITIDLDKKLTPAQNAQKYFKQYNKYKTAIKEIVPQIEHAQAEVQYLEQILVCLDQIVQLSDLEEINRELIETGYVKGKSGKKQKKPSTKENFLKFESSDHYTIWVGKNNLQNDEITTKLSNRDDLWLHIKDMPGSHTILRTVNGTYSDQALLEAATLAAFYSKAKEATKVAVDYTLRKNVKKPSGAKPGMVIYDPYQTIIVDGSLANFPHLKRITNQ